ncbi:MAG: 16S rRNA (cytidine(1402)-2'-O)-methyltransferase [Candidatus Sedimenticola endophacoides]
MGSDVSINKGVLYVVATPIGNLDDISARAVEVLRGVALIGAEDTRHSRPLLRHLGVGTPLIALHEHNERQILEGLIRRLEEGESLAIISDAGTPLISDPGFPLVRECHRQGIRVSPVPGASALIAALSAAGLPTDRFVFEGFPARNGAARQRQFGALAAEPRTLVFYESSHRILASLRDMAVAFGPLRRAALGRELTKLHETLLYAPLDELARRVEEDVHQQKGEFVVVVAGAPPPGDETLAPDTQRLLRILCGELPLKQAAALAARITGEKKNRLYQAGLGLQPK